MECLLCCETESFIGVGLCGHQPFCYKCIYKLHIVTKDQSCPICKEHLDLLVITDKEGATFNDIKKLKLLKSKSFANILFDGELARSQFEKLTEYRCFAPKCEETKGFQSIAFLKKHLKEKHNRYLCDICIDSKRCVLQEHKLYSFKTLESHQSHGDFDEFGNLVFLHPYCSFCKQHFFDEEGLRKHLSKQHYYCNTCPDTYKFTFYKDYKSLEVHFKMTHYICPEEDCIAKGFIVFKTNSDLLAHKYVEHEKNYTGEKKTKDMTAISGFYTESTKQEESKIKFHDKEGVNFQDEFLSLKKLKHRGFYHVEEQQDGELDFRFFYKKNIDQEQLYQMAFDNTVRKNNKAGRKQQYRQKSDRNQKNTQKVEEGNLMLEDLHLVKTTHLPAIQWVDFDKKLNSIFSQEEYQKFSELRHGYNKKKTSAAEFLAGFLKLFSGRRQGYNIWPQYIRTVQNQATKQELDAAYLSKIKTLPIKTQNLINVSKKFSDFMIKLTDLIEKNIEERIVNGTLNIRKKIKIDKARIFQMIQILRHMRAVDMIKLKFAANFSILPETLHFIETKIFVEPLEKVQTELHKISQAEFLNFYLYIKFCRDVLVGKKIHLEKQFIKQEILEEYLDRRPDLQYKYGKRKESMSLQEQAEFQEAEEKKKMEKLQQKTFTKKNVLIDNTDKYEFPELIQSKKEEDKKVFDPKANISNQEYKQTFVYETKKTATRQKNLNQYFPSIGEAQKQTQNQSVSEAAEKKVQPTLPTEKPWWEKVSGKVEEKVQEGKMVGEIGRKKKRGREVIEIQGGFR